MSNDLKHRLEKQRASLMRERRFSGFSNALAQHVSYTPSHQRYASFDETAEILNRLRVTAESIPPKFTATLISKHDLIQFIECLIERLGNVSTAVVLHDHYLFVGALEINLHDALSSIDGFFRVGEDMVVIVDAGCSNYLTFEREQLDHGGSFQYEARIGGRDWPAVSTFCFECEKPLGS